MSTQARLTRPHRSPAPVNRHSTTLDRLIPFSVGALVGLAALVTALVLPRGPVTAAQVGAVLLSSLLIGLCGGRWLRSRWAPLLLPLAYIIIVEIVRMPAVGPTVDRIRLDTPFGILALILGRGFHGLAALLPMVLGVGLGRAWRQARHVGQAPLRAIIRRPLLVITGLLVVSLALINAIPARTPPILGADGRPIPGSIAELSTVRLGGRPQAILIRGRSADLPVLLYLSGGPGQSDLPFARALFADLTEQFIVVGWDQRGTGKSYGALDPTGDLTLAQLVADTIELSSYLRERFAEEKIYLMGESWGSTLGVLAVQQRPDLYHAWIGSGQMVSQRETDRRLYAALLDLAERSGDAALRDRLLGFGEPPYADVPYPNAVVMGYYGQLGAPYTPPPDYIERGTAANLGPYGIFAEEYTLVEKVNVLRGLIDMFAITYPQLQGIDLRRDVPRLEVPVYLLDGAAELPARREIALEWYTLLEAPLKRSYTFENAGHSVAFEQFTALHERIAPTILAETGR